MIGGLVARHTLTRQRAGRVSDGMNGFEDDWDTPDELAIPGWAIDAGNTVEDQQNRDGAEVEYTARGPFTADVTALDRLVYAGDVYEIKGGIRRQPGPSSATSHTILLLTRWEG